MSKQETITIPDFASEIGVSRFTVQKWVQSGKVKGKKSGPFPGKTSRILIPISELERIKRLIKENEIEPA